MVIEFLFLAHPISICIDGGWGVDALLRIQSRPHGDLDIIINRDDYSVLSRLLQVNGYIRESTDESVYISPTGLSVDIHCVRFDERGYGAFELPDGGEWPFPPTAFQGEGQIGNISVKCLSPDAQIQCHAQGYILTAKDLKDMLALQDRFQIVLPLQFYIAMNNLKIRK